MSLIKPDVTEYILAKSTHFSLLSLIFIISNLFSFEFGLFSPLGMFTRLLSNACWMFSEIVFHSKDIDLLSILHPFLWFTVGLPSLLERKCKATNLCVLNFFTHPLDKETYKYPS